MSLTPLSCLLLSVLLFLAGAVVPVVQGLSLHSGQLNTPASVSMPLLPLLLLLAASLVPFVLVGVLRGNRRAA